MSERTNIANAEISSQWALFRGRQENVSNDLRPFHAEFDRWLAEHDREVEQKAREDQRDIDAGTASAQLFRKGFLAHAFNVVGAIQNAPLGRSLEPQLPSASGTDRSTE